jgi:hypothetical protein
MKGMEDVRRIQDDLVIIVEELVAIRRRLRALREETSETPSYRLS